MPCKIHPERELTCLACQGAKGGKSKSPEKQTAARKNGRRNKPKLVRDAAEEVMRVADRMLGGALQAVKTPSSSRR